VETFIEAGDDAERVFVLDHGVGRGKTSGLELGQIGMRDER
jgi:hypothetical protein